jgi:hypothetical protein
VLALSWLVLVLLHETDLVYFTGYDTRITGILFNFFDGFRLGDGEAGVMGMGWTEWGGL